MILAQAHPHEGEDELADRLLRTRPQAWPNSRMVAFADELLDRNGRLMAATTGIYAQQLAKRPELGEIMRRGNRAREVDLGLNGKRVAARRNARSEPSPQSARERSIDRPRGPRADLIGNVRPWGPQQGPAKARPRR